MLDWDDLRIFIAAARTGTLASAAKRVHLDAATISRRISRLETALKATLFVRSPSGLQLTATGSRLMEMSLDAESAMNAVATVTDPNPVGGTLRLSVSEGFGTQIVAAALPGLRQSRPGLRIELAANAGFLSAAMREVDMSVTLSAPTAQRLHVEPLTDYELGLYGSTEYLSADGPRPTSLADLARCDVVGYIDDLIYAPELKYLDEIGAELRPAITSSSICAQKEIIAAGGGVGILPCFMANGLVRIMSDEIRLMRRFWIGVHDDVKDSVRIRTVRRWLHDLCLEHKERLSPSHAVAEHQHLT